jgi:hypothetical protein
MLAVFENLSLIIYGSFCWHFKLNVNYIVSVHIKFIKGPILVYFCDTSLFGSFQGCTCFTAAWTRDIFNFRDALVVYLIDC